MKRAVAWLRAKWQGEEKAVAGAYRTLFAPENPQARIVLADLARYCNCNETSFTVGDPHLTSFNEGSRAALLHIADMTGLSPADFAALEKETER